MSLSLLRLHTSLLGLSTRRSLTSCRRSMNTQPTPSLVLPATGDEWRALWPPNLPTLRERVCVRNQETANDMAEQFISGKSIAAGDNKIIIEAFPGPGALSRALLNMKNVKKLIILEDCEPFLEWLRPLEADPRVTIVDINGYDWSAYQLIEERGLISEVEIVPWENGVHPQLHFISHIPHNIKGEQLIAQLFRCIPERSWLFRYGRVPMSFVLGEWLWERVTAPLGTSARCKVSVISEAVAQLQNALRPSTLLPYDDHFHPTTVKTSLTRKPSSRRIGHPMMAVNVIPHAEQVITKDNLEKWDYILRRLFVLKASPLSKAISSLAPGATVLLKTLTDPRLPPEQRVNPKKTVRNLTLTDWVLIVRAFENWPFAPENLMILSNTRDERHN